MVTVDDQLDATFAALADATRRALLARLAISEATVNELADPFDLSLQTVSKHLKVLEHCGLISRTRQAQYRPCHLEPIALQPAAEWIERQRLTWSERFDRLEQHLGALQTGAPDPRSDDTRQGVSPDERHLDDHRADAHDRPR
jgi:DNA-binding transcriptional ArsR family regulator